MKCLILINPGSKGGKGLKNFDKFRKELDKREVDRTEIMLSDIREATERAASCDTSLYDTVVAAGGDGTIRAAGAGGLKNPDQQLKFGVLYTGTSPDFCRFHKIPLEPEKAVEALIQKQIKKIPLLTANGEPFFCSCNPGMGAEVAEKANRFRPFLGDFAGTLLAVLSTLIKNPRYNFTLNGRELEACSHLLISRMPYIAGGLQLLSPSLKDDEFFIWYLKKVSLFQWLKVLYSLYTCRPCGTFETFSVPLHIDTPGHADTPLEFDGDPHGTMPLEINFAPRFLNLIIPAGVNGK